MTYIDLSSWIQDFLFIPLVSFHSEKNIYRLFEFRLRCSKRDEIFCLRSAYFTREFTGFILMILSLNLMILTREKSNTETDNM